MTEWHRKAGTASRAGFEVVIGPREAGWKHAGLYIAVAVVGVLPVIVRGRKPDVPIGCSWQT